MTTATYPDDAIAPITAFSVVADTTFTNTGALRVAFNLPSSVESKGEVTVFQEGILQSTGSYSLSNAGQTITFIVAPNATELIVKTISLPARYRLNRTFPAVAAEDYSSTPTVTNGNTYTINGVTEGFANTLIGANAAHGNSVTLTTGDQNTLVGRNIQTTADDSYQANGLGYFLSCEGGYTTVGQTSSDIRAAHGNVTWATVSDERFKKNIETSDAGLAVINDLRPVTYNWKTMGEIPEWSRWYEEGSDEQYKNSKLNHGFIAQEVKAVIDSHSELKDGFSMWYEREDGQQEVGETAIVPILVKAVQELSATVTTLQQEIKILKEGL